VWNSLEGEFMSELIFSAGIFSMLGEGIIDIISGFLYGILLWFNCIIYSFISFTYNIFLILANGGNIFDANKISGMINRIYVVLGVVVLFLVAYSLLKSMINPDEALKGKKSPVNVIKDVVISVCLVALVPSIFEFAFNVQNAFLSENTIGKIIIGNNAGSSDSGDSANTIRNGGYEMAAGVWQAFIYPNPNGNESGTPYCSTLDEERAGQTAFGVACVPLNLEDELTYGQAWRTARDDSSFFGLYDLLIDPILTDKVTYLFLLDIIAGVFVLFVMLRYCLDMALRLVKLAVYELMAPLPILARLMPNEQTSKVFSNWVKATVSTFVEVFIRIAILYFAVLIISTVGSSIGKLFMGGSYVSSEALPFVVYIARGLIIIGIVMFVRQAPEILKEITGVDSGKYGKSLIKGVGMMGAVFGGGATAAIRSVVGDKKNNPDFSTGKRAARALTAAGGAMGRGLWQGNKVNKFGEIPKAAGKSASGSLDFRSAQAAAGGKRKYFEQKRDDTKKRIEDWMGGASEELKALKKINDELLKQIDSIKSIADDYIGKHEYEFFTDATVQREYNRVAKLKADAKSAGDMAEAARQQAELDRIMDLNKESRLDYLKSKSQDMTISADERNKYERRYNQARKDTTDDFAREVQFHTGAELEATQVADVKKTLGELMKEYRTAPAVQYATTSKGHATYSDIADGLTSDDLLDADKTAIFIKNLKKATKYSNTEIQSKINENERREERRKSASGGGDKK